jgi:hypothetical protein
MASTAGRFYWSPGAEQIHKCLAVDSNGVTYDRIPSGVLEQTNKTDPQGASFTELQAVMLTATNLPQVIYKNDAYEVAEAYSTDGTSANTACVLLRPTTPSVAAEKANWFVVEQQQVLPVVTAVAPTALPAAGGPKVVLTGSGFTAAKASGSTVKFGATSAAAFTVDSDTQITVPVSPAHIAATVHVTVVTPIGTSATSSADQVTYS